MGIDRIGKGGAPPPDASGATDGVTGKTPAEKPFAIDRPGESQGVEGTSQVDASSPLMRLRRGEIDVNGYVDLKVDEATRGLEGLSPVELDAIRKVLRDQIATDPGLTDLVRQATGHVPDVPEE